MFRRRAIVGAALFRQRVVNEDYTVYVECITLTEQRKEEQTAEIVSVRRVFNHSAAPDEEQGYLENKSLPFNLNTEFEYSNVLFVEIPPSWTISE